ncbi:MAG: HAD family hydrolase [Candidatus Competibacteraceae bacterium]|nr:HAD family hydrolase [Candidatus Competibacteraceae bacterium]
MSINIEWKKVKDFHMAFHHPVANIPALMAPDRVEKRYKWMMEEVDEFLESNTLEDQADAMIDLIYFALGTLVELGIKPERMFEIVHQANMSKLGESGKPNFNEDGKVIKPTTWESPEPKLKEEIQTQIRKANNA